MKQFQEEMFQRDKVATTGCDSAEECLGEAAEPRMSEVDRSQVVLQRVDVEELIPQDHRARLIWEVVGQLDLGAYAEKIKAVEGRAGRTPITPRLLVSIWIYAYSIGEGSAREIARLCAHDPAFLWLTGRARISAKTLSNFRSGDEAALKGLFSQVLGRLKAKKLIDLQRVAQDGTKIRAYASRRSFRRGRTIEQQIEQAQEHIRKVDAEAGSVSTKRAQARKRAARERAGLLAEARKIAAEIAGTKKDAEEARASVSDPDARIMKEANGGFGPNYNAQLVTDAKSGMVVEAHLSQSSSDAESLKDGIQHVQDEFKESPQEVLADGGYVSKENILAMEAKKINFYAPPPDNEARTRGLKAHQAIEDDYRATAFTHDAETDSYRCPQGAVLVKISTSKGQHVYQAPRETCQACECKPKCCPKAKENGRSLVRVERTPEVDQFYERMRTEGAVQIRKQRSQLAEFPNAWLKSKIKLRQFRLRGKVKAGMELLWGCLAYDLSRAFRICPEFARA